MAAVLRGMQSGVAAVIADVTVNLCGTVYKETRALGILVMLAAFSASWFFSVNVLWIILACALFGVGRTWVLHRKGEMA